MTLIYHCSHEHGTPNPPQCQNPTSASPHPNPTQTFHLFPHLPLELRRQIWIQSLPSPRKGYYKHAARARQVGLVAYNLTPSTYMHLPRSAIPHVNSEARGIFIEVLGGLDIGKGGNGEGGKGVMKVDSVGFERDYGVFSRIDGEGWIRRILEGGGKGEKAMGPD